MIPGIVGSNVYDAANLTAVPRINYSLTVHETALVGTGLSFSNSYSEYIAHGANGQILLMGDSSATVPYFGYLDGVDDTLPTTFTAANISASFNGLARGCWTFVDNGVLTWVISDQNGAIYFTTGPLTGSNTWTRNLTNSSGSSLTRVFLNPNGGSQKWVLWGNGTDTVRYSSALDGTFINTGVAGVNGNVRLGCQALVNGNIRYIASVDAGATSGWISPIAGVNGTWTALAFGAGIYDINYGDGYIVAGGASGTIRAARCDNTDTPSFAAVTINTNGFSTTNVTSVMYEGGFWTADVANGRAYAYNKSGDATTAWTGGTNGNINPGTVCSAPDSQHSMYLRWGQGTTNRRFYWGI